MPSKITTETALFTPLKLGSITLNHRTAMAPLTRLRATPTRIPSALMKEYYTQRASVPGTLLITEGTLVSHAASGGFPCAPGIWRDDQVAAWKEITDEVHKKECFIYIQLFAMGRAARSDVAAADGVDVIAPSAIPISEDERPGAPVPHAMSVTEIKRFIEDFVAASKNAIAAGFDGVEIHGANGYLLDQFLQDTSNHRDDEYGGSIENRSRLLHEVLTQVTDAIGSERVGLRLSPWSRFQGMRMADPIPQFVDIISKANALNLAFLHLVEPRVSGPEEARGRSAAVAAVESLDFAYKLWKNTLLVAGGFNLERAKKLIDEEYPDKDIVVVFGRHFISNPDLVFRLKEGLPLAKYDRETFYVPGEARGYADYPFCREFEESVAA
ncbi:alkene reductase [Aspergillus stella-maris]|uniref:alkene reductase n=1 Tax=Aspergillus stella-maris TaxID=1810926 RepID=UPI003CCCDF15